MSQREETPWWATALIYGGLAVGAIVGVVLIVSNVFLGGVNAYKDMWTKQYDALMKKMAEYQKSNPSGFTEAQKQNIAEEEKVLQLTTQGLANAAGGLYNTLTWIAGIIVGAAALVGISSIAINAWLKKTSGQLGTAHGASYVAVMALADDLAAKGYPIEATNLVTSAQTMFQSYDLPFMQQTIISLQNSLNFLTGVQLLVAQQMIQALTVEIVAIPVWFATPLPLI